MTASLIPNQLSNDQPLKGRTAALRAVEQTSDRASLHLVVPEGQLQVHTAPYRGSFSGVLSEALRAAGLGSQVMIVQFLKGGVNQGPNGIVELCGRLEWLRPSIPCCLPQTSFDQIENESTTNLEKAVEEVWMICRNRLLKGDLDQLVLEEVGLAISLGYLKEEDLISTLEKRPPAMDVILTGPAIPERITSMADQVTELRSGI